MVGSNTQVWTVQHLHPTTKRNTWSDSSFLLIGLCCTSHGWRRSFMLHLTSLSGSGCASCLLIHQCPQMEHHDDTEPNNPEQYRLSIGGRQATCIVVSSTLSPPLFTALLLPGLLFILMWSGWSSWWWHGVDYAVPTVTYSKTAEGSAIVASDLWMTALPVAPAPHWRAHGERGAGRMCGDVYSTCPRLFNTNTKTFDGLTDIRLVRKKRKYFSWVK